MPQIKNGAEHRPRTNPKDRPDYSEVEVQALRAVYRGTGTPDQQKLAIDYILTVASNMYDIVWRADPSMKDLCIGQALVGQHLVWLLNRAETTTDESKISSRPEQK